MVAAMAVSAGVYAQTGTIVIDVKDITPDDATAVITPSDNDMKYYWGLSTKYNFYEEVGGAEAMAESQISLWKQAAAAFGMPLQDVMGQYLTSGAVEERLSVHYVVHSDTDYVLFAFGVSPEGDLQTDVAVKEFTNKVPANTLTIELKDEEPVDATVLITPSSDDITYYWGLSTLASFEADGGADKVVENRINVWKANASYWDDTTWQEVMSWDLKSGVVEEKLSERFNLYPANDYVIYAFGMDAQGEVTAPVTLMEYSTVAAIPSDNTFTISLLSVQPDQTQRMNVKAKVIPANSDRYTARLIEKQYIARYDLTPGSPDEKEFINQYMLDQLNDSRIYSGEQTLEFNGITPDADVCLFVMGVDENKAPSTGLTKMEFKTERWPSRSIALEVSDVTPMNAHIKVTPSDPDMRYYIDIAPAALVEEKGGEDCIPEKFIIDWWKYIASLYDGQYKWQDFIEPQTRTGSLDTDIADLVEEGILSHLYWNDDWVLYAVGFSTDGEILTTPATAYFTTPAPQTSDLAFEFELVSTVKDEAQSKLEPYTATVNIIPSREGEEFKVNYTRTSTYDAWVNNEDYGMTEFIKSQWLENAVSFTDAVQLVMPGLNRYADFEGTEQTYTLMVMGWNEGPATEPAIFEVGYKEGSGLTLNETDRVKVAGGESEITVSGRCGNVVVYTAAGQIAGALRGEGRLSVPAGIYVVRYEREGKTATCKVAVR